jgi:hypothetical protein
MYCVIGSLIAGAAAGEGARKVSWRPLVKGTFKQGIVLSRKLRSLSEVVRKEAEQLVNEARAELDGPATPSDAAQKI